MRISISMRLLQYMKVNVPSNSFISLTGSYVLINTYFLLLFQNLLLFSMVVLLQEKKLLKNSFAELDLFHPVFHLVFTYLCTLFNINSALLVYRYKHVKTNLVLLLQTRYQQVLKLILLKLV